MIMLAVETFLSGELNPSDREECGYNTQADVPVRDFNLSASMFGGLCISINGISYLAFLRQS